MRNRELMDKKLKKKKKKDDMLKSKFLDTEAALGSDNEANDDVVKRIDKNDYEEDEEGLDSDLEGFVDNDAPAGDAEEIAEADARARELYNAHVEEDEKKETRDTMRALFYGQNKKRRRGELGDEDDLDGTGQAVRKRIMLAEERQQRAL